VIAPCHPIAAARCCHHSKAMMVSCDLTGETRSHDSQNEHASPGCGRVRRALSAAAARAGL